MPTTKSANQGKQNDESKRGQQSSTHDNNRQRDSMSMNKTNKSDNTSSRSHK